MAFMQIPIKDGEFTSTIYGMIRDNRYTDVNRILQVELQRQPNSRAALSLLGYIYYQTQDYAMASEMYGKLSSLYPQHSDYKLYHAQSLYKSFMFSEAEAVMEKSADDSNITKSLLKLASAIKYSEEDYLNARLLVDQYDADDTDAEVNLACIDFKMGEYQTAIEKFRSATRIHGYRSDLAYSLALCHYQLGEIDQTMRFIAEIVERGVKDHPELAVGMVSEGVEMRSVGNSQLLNETALIEALNLKFAIEYKAKNIEKAAVCLTDMPPRNEDEVDPVSLHNQALMSIESNLAESFEKFQFLIGLNPLNPFPPETFANLLLLYCKYEYYDLAADLLAENPHLSIKYLTEYVFNYIDALIVLQTSPVDAYNKFDALATDQMNHLRRAKARLDEAIAENDTRTAEKANEDVRECLGRYMPVLMAQAKIVWDREDYDQVESLFRRSSELCSSDEVWRLNLAHTLFMQEKYKESADCYAPIVNSKIDRMLDISAIVLANLCSCYILMNNNAEAEEVMKRVEREELLQPDKKFYHLCIINLVIGTLYCAKSNFDFGVNRVLTALEPCDRKLGTDTWYYCKRCLLAMFEQVAKQLLLLRDKVMDDCLEFLKACERNGREVSTVTDSLLLHSHPTTDPSKTVAFEARILRALLLKLVN